MRVAIILLAGSGVRFGEEFPKQFYTLNSHPLIYYTIKSFEEAKCIDAIVLVAKKEHAEAVSTLVTKSKFKKVKFIVNGGNTRQESSFNALKFLSSSLKDDDIVMIHDGARPFVDEAIISGHISAMEQYEALTTAIPPSDTIAYSEDGMTIANVPDRSHLYQVQTPQTFRFGLIYASHKNAVNKSYSDDCQLVLAIGHQVGVVLGNKKLLKVTTKEDVVILDALTKGE